MRAGIENLDAELLELRGAGVERLAPSSHLVVRKRLRARGRMPMRPVLERHVETHENDPLSSELDGEIDRVEARVAVSRSKARPHDSRFGR